MSTDLDILAALRAAGMALTIPDLAERLGLPRRGRDAARLARDVERLGKAGRLRIHRPGIGIRGPRLISLDGDTVESLRHENTELRSAMQAALTTLSRALAAPSEPT